MVFKSFSTDAPFLFGEAENEPCLHYLMDFHLLKTNILTSITTMLHLLPYQMEGLISLFGFMLNYEPICLFVDVTNMRVSVCLCH